jgi:hypothetical protein
MPRVGDVFADARGGERALRVSWHAEAGMVILSLWSGRVCRASFRLPAEEVPRLLRTLAAAAPEAARDETTGDCAAPGAAPAEPGAVPAADPPAPDPPEAPPMAHAC